MKPIHLVALPLLTTIAAAQIVAFPGAQGYGAYAKGGRGGDVYHVTNLNASGAGSFAYGVTTGVPAAGRTIVFDVSGYAHISGTVRITNNKITIAGQTAPGDGFGLKDGTFLVSGDDIIIRHMRFRDGNSADAVNLDSNSANTIFDHSEAMFGNDENMSTFGSPPENLTFQWSLNAWGMESHSCGGLWDMNHATSAYSLWAHNHTRNPKARPGLLEWINNVTFDWDIGFIMGDSQSNANWKANAIGCYFIGPPGNTHSKAFSSPTIGTNGRPNFTLHLSNCWTDIDGDGVLNGYDRGYGIVEGTSYADGQLPAPVAGDSRYYVSASPLPGSTAPMTIDPPLLAYKKVLSNAGPLRLDYDPAKPLRDEVANLLVTNVELQRRYHVSSAAGTGLPNGGFGNLNSTPAPVDSDQDGIPDFFEAAVTRTGDVWGSTVVDHNSVCPNSALLVSEPTFFPANTSVGSAAADKYTHLEEYLHFLSVPHAVMAKSTVAVPSFIDIDLRKFTRGFTTGVSFSVSNVLNGTATLQPNGYTVRFTAPTANFTGLTVPYGRAKFEFTVLDAAGSTWTQRFDILVSNNALPRNLGWLGDGTTNAWNTLASNWIRQANATTYADPDYVSFDDTGSNSPNISLTETVSPSAININSTQNYSFTTSNGSFISGSTALRKFGTGSLTLATPNTYSGGTVVDGSTLVMANGGGIGSGALTLQNGAVFTNGYPDGSSTGIAALTVPVGSSATFNSGNRLAINGALTGGGYLTYNVETAVSRFDLKGYSGAFTGSVAFTGSGNVRIYSSSGFGGFDGAAVDVGPNVSWSPQTNSTGNGFAIGSLSGGGPASVLGGATSTGALNYSIGALNQNTTYAGSIQGNATLTKVGTGVFTLTGNSNYTGATAVNTGSLILNGALGTTPVTVASGATLSGTGSTGGTVSVANGGILSPGTGGIAGTIRPNALSLVAGSVMPLDLSSNPSAGSDKITLGTGVLTLTGTLTLQFNLLDGILGPGTYALLDGGTNTAASGAVLASNLPGGARQSFSLQRPTSGNGQCYINLVVTNTAATLTWLGSPTGTWNTNGVQNFTGAPESPVPNNKFLPFDAALFKDTDANGGTPSGNVTIGGAVSPRTLTVDNTALNYNISGGAITGGGKLIKNGNGTLTLAPSVLTLSSTTTVGTTVTVDTTNLGTGMNVTGTGIPGGTMIASITNATTLVLSQAATAAATVNLNYFGNSYSGGTFLNGGTIVLADDLANGYALGTGPITFGNGTTLAMYNNTSGDNGFNNNIVVPPGVTATLNGDSRIVYNGRLTGGGILNFREPYIRGNVLGDWSAYTGTINVTTDGDGGEFRYGTSYYYPGFPQAAIALQDRVTMYYLGTVAQGTGTTISIGELSGTTLARLSGGQASSGGRPFIYRIGGKGTDATFAGTISELDATVTNTSFVKTGVGTWTLGGTCSWNGNTTIEQGVLRIAGSLTSPQAMDVASGASLSLLGGTVSADAVNLAPGATLTGYGTFNGDLNNDGTVTSLTGGTLAVSGDVVNNGLMRIASGTALVATGNFINNGILDLLTAAQGLPANFENHGIVIDSSTLAMSSVSKSGSVVLVKVPTHSGHAYQMQRSASLVSGWADVGASQNGISTILGAPTERTFTDPAATGSSYFYRIKVTP